MMIDGLAIEDSLSPYGRSVSVVPCDHLEWQPPHSNAETGSWSCALMDNTREPESSAGTNRAEHDEQRWSVCDGTCLRDVVKLVMRHCSGIVGGGAA